MKPDELAAILEPEVKANWFTKLPKQVRIDLCAVRRGYLAAAVKPTQPVLLQRLRAKYEGLPQNIKRLGEFLRNEAGIYPDEECADGTE
jgi:hypothetical protein